MQREKTKKILIQRAKSLYFQDYLFLDVEEKELQSFIERIKEAKTKREINQIIKTLFN